MTTIRSTDIANPFAAVTAGVTMHPGVLSVPSTASMQDVARTMVAQGVHAVLVRPDDPRVLGWPSRVVTDRDIVKWAVAGEPDRVRAVDAASEPAGLVLLDWTLQRAAQLMVDLAETHVLVAARESHLPDGVLSSFDLTAIAAGRDPRIARMVHIGPARPARSERRLDHILVRDAMHSGVIACSPAASIVDVAASMADHRVHCVVVAGVDGDRLVWKTVDTMDVVKATRPWDPSRPAAEIARHEPIAVDEDETMLAAAQVMAEERVGHIVAVDASGAPSGVVSSLDVAAICATG